MKGILFIGGGILQVPALNRAKELKFTIYLIDGSKNCYGKDHCDFFYEESTKDVEAVARIASDLKREGKIIAVYTQGTDVAYTVAYAAKAAGLPGISPEAAFNCNNKIKAREILAKAGVDDTLFQGVTKIEELSSAVKKVGFPCYVKPADNCASRGLTRLENRKGLDEAFSLALSNCYHTKAVIIEREIPGEEFSVDTVLFNGKLYPAGVSDRVFQKKVKFAVQTGSRTPSLTSEKIQEEMYKVMEKAALALGIENGAFKGDLVVTPNGKVKIIEVTARTSGGFDSQVRKPLSFGIDIIKATIDIACGFPLDPRDLIPKWVKWSETFSIFPKPGVVTKISGLDKLEKMKGVQEIKMLVKKGSVIEPYVHCATRTNFIIIKGDTLEDLDIIKKNINKTLVIETKNK